MSIHYKTSREIELLRHANQIVADTLTKVWEMIEPGVSTKDLDRMAESNVRKSGGTPAFKGYKGFPATLCTSINEQIVHGIPNKRHTLKDGDIVSVDCGVFYKGYCGDAAMTFPVGDVDDETMRLLDVTRASLRAGIGQIEVGKYLNDLSGAVQDVVEHAGFNVVRSFIGHGVGRDIHEAPEVPNFRTGKKGPMLKKGMVLAIEPMVTAGSHEVEVLSDGWTAVTKDRSLSAHFEHSVAITADGPYILSAELDAIDIRAKASV